MTDRTKRVVVTGMGAVSCTGLTIEVSWANVLAGNSGIDRLDLYDASALNVHIGGQAWGFDPAKYMDPRDARRRDRFCQLAVAATRQALEDAALRITDNGIGFNPQINRSGAGFKNIEMRVTFLKGRYRVRSHPYEGTSLMVAVPIAPSALEDLSLRETAYSKIWNIFQPTTPTNPSLAPLHEHKFIFGHRDTSRDRKSQISTAGRPG